MGLIIMLRDTNADATKVLLRFNVRLLQFNATKQAIFIL